MIKKVFRESTSGLEKLFKFEMAEKEHVKGLEGR
jgi:hypothetical protein